MKKFAFPLQRLLEYKEQVLDMERTALAEMNAVLDTLKAELVKMESQHHERLQLFREKSRSGMAAIEMETHKNFLTLLDFAIKHKKQQIKLQQNAIDKQMDKVREAKTEISTMEKLKERKLEEYNFAAQKAEEIFIEEYVSFARIAESV